MHPPINEGGWEEGIEVQMLLRVMKDIPHSFISLVMFPSLGLVLIPRSPSLIFLFLSFLMLGIYWCIFLT
ncbi:hypothetical protein DFH27DRAFT_577586 [Peziza echinospora]|nr:hypothetical protein DFH27DRAFT_587155 [Peziza echinospora]KAI5783861.1 hypothetical protein DFH27DRAFT_577586 [Peziza echinospora]